VEIWKNIDIYKPKLDIINEQSNMIIGQQRGNQLIPQIEPVYEGNHDGADCNTISGWAWDMNKPDTPIYVDIYDGSTLLATLRADEFRQDLVEAGKGNGKHAFNYPVPLSLKDGKPHSILVRVLQTNFELASTPKQIHCRPTDKDLVIKWSLGYIPAKETISAAKREGLSVCDYVEKLWGKQGDTQKVINQMASCGLFDVENPHVLEIGAGTGRYLEKVLEKCRPAKYEIYEIARDWAEWLQSTYPIVSHEADGMSLSQTSDHSIDILHAHGVFVYLPFLISYRYFREIWRVMKSGGSVIFDIYSEDCMDEATVEKWLSSEHDYPCFLSKGYVISLFERQGFSLVATFMNSHGEGRSEYLVFELEKS
jgi:phospholipid N-methyltransferase